MQFLTYDWALQVIRVITICLRVIWRMRDSHQSRGTVKTLSCSVWGDQSVARTALESKWTFSSWALLKYLWGHLYVCSWVSRWFFWISQNKAWPIIFHICAPLRWSSIRKSTQFLWTPGPIAPSVRLFSLSSQFLLTYCLYWLLLSNGFWGLPSLVCLSATVFTANCLTLSLYHIHILQEINQFVN